MSVITWSEMGQLTAQSKKITQAALMRILFHFVTETFKAGVNMNLSEILESLKRLKVKKWLLNTTRQLPDPTMGPQVELLRNCLLCIYQFLTSNCNFKTTPNLQNFLFP